MELKKFIAETLSQIVEGVVEANRQIAQHGAAVNPPNVAKSKDGQGGAFHGYGKPKWARRVENVDFDVSLSVSTSTATSGEGGVQIAVLKLGTTGKTDSGTESESRIKFSIPLMLPNSKESMSGS